MFLLTVHALLLQGGLAPCIPASQTYTHIPQCDSLWEKKKHNTADQSCSARLLCTRGPWQKQWCLRPAFLNHWLVKRLPPVRQLMCTSLACDTSLFFWDASGQARWCKHIQKHTNANAHVDKCSAVCGSCCLICKTLPSNGKARKAIRGSSRWALDCIPLTFIQWFMSKDLSPSQWDLHTQLLKTHNKGKGWSGGGNLKSSCEDCGTYITPNYQNFSQPLQASLLFVRLTQYLQCHWRVYNACVPTWLAKTLLLFLPRWVLLHNGGLEGSGLRAGLPNKALVACSRQESVFVSQLPKTNF